LTAHAVAVSVAVPFERVERDHRMGWHRGARLRIELSLEKVGAGVNGVITPSTGSVRRRRVETLALRRSERRKLCSYIEITESCCRAFHCCLLTRLLSMVMTNMDLR
jgi:hypothetical protein